MFKILDLYIIRKFLGTFIFSIALIMMVVVVFDVSEKLGDFMDRKAPFKAIVFDYYLNFIPYFANLFSPLFVFISVIYFTSRMSTRTEFVAILSSGVSFNRIVFVPYMISAGFIAAASLYLNHFVIPQATQERLEFEDMYVYNSRRNEEKNIHRQIQPGTVIYFSIYEADRDIGHQFSIDKFENEKRVWHLRSDYVQWDTLKGKWSIHNYFIREIDGMNEKIRTGHMLDTLMNFRPDDFEKRITDADMMTTPELNVFIEEEKVKGSQEIDKYLIKKHERTSMPFAAFILTLIGVSLASRKVRGGIGLHLGLGIGICFTYIMFMQIFAQLSIKGGLEPAISVWIPNIVFLALAIFMLRTAQK